MKSVLNFSFCFGIRLNSSNIELSQVVSQVSGYTAPSLSDDLLQLDRMTLSDIIQAEEVT